MAHEVGRGGGGGGDVVSLRVPGCRAALESVDPTLLDDARTLGATPARAFVRVALHRPRLDWDGLAGLEAEAFLRCGDVRYGFVEVSCEDCHEARLVAFCCKGRGWCPSCTNRRAVETGVRLAALLPQVRHRQWTMSLPFCLRFVVVKRPALLKRLAVPDNLREGVLKPDVYEPTLNPLYRDVLKHYGVVALSCRVRHPDRKGKVESGIGHTQRTPLPNRREGWWSTRRSHPPCARPPHRPARGREVGASSPGRRRAPRPSPPSDRRPGSRFEVLVLRRRFDKVERYHFEEGLPFNYYKQPKPDGPGLSSNSPVNKSGASGKVNDDYEAYRNAMKAGTW
ncbi:MAG: transposase zinc-binding domain-containing protein [Myxococcales bacterium]|nr:transposase zinc-binding domain-containing protein [Myxococcales bacterium]